jgi:6-phospho-beta-glucosidase
MLDIAHRMEKLAPDAWLVNFSNPSGIIAEALLNHTHIQMIGLCNCFINMHAELVKTTGTKDFDYEYIGLNHLSWVTKVMLDGKNILNELGTASGAQMKNVPKVEYDEELIAAIPAIPSSYLSYFYLRDEQIKNCCDAEKTRGEICVELEESLIKKYSDPNLQDKPKELESRGGSLYSTAAVSVVDAIENDKNEYHVVGVKNAGILPFMDNNDVVELKCLVNRKGATPVAISNPDNQYITGLMQAVKAYEKLTVRALINGSRADALAALMVHPLIGDYHKAKGVLDEMFEANADYIPKELLKS